MTGSRGALGLGNSPINTMQGCVAWTPDLQSATPSSFQMRDVSVLVYLLSHGKTKARNNSNANRRLTTLTLTLYSPALLTLHSPPAK